MTPSNKLWCHDISLSFVTFFVSYLHLPLSVWIARAFALQITEYSSSN